MRCPALSDLPPAPPGRAGWPWTQESPALPRTMKDGRPWPRVSVVTPSFNQGPFLEETLRSVLLQGYPDLEYIVIDGGSRDESPAILRAYQPWLAHWESAPDHGQAAAVNKGLRRATGELIGWLNSDDLYVPGTLAAAASALARAGGPAAVTGDHEEVDAGGAIRGTQYGRVPTQEDLAVCRGYFSQPATFFARTALDRVGALDESLRYVMDHDLFLRMRGICSFQHLPRVLARVRYHAAAKTGSQRLPMLRELLRVCGRYWGPSPSVARWRCARQCRRRIALSALLLAAEVGVVLGERGRAARLLAFGCGIYPPHAFSRLAMGLGCRLVLGNRAVTRLKRSLGWMGDAGTAG